MLVVIVCIVFLTPIKARKAKNKKRIEQAGYFRDAPNDGYLDVTDRLGLCSGLCAEDALLGAYLMRLISRGCLERTDNSLDAKAVRLWLNYSSSKRQCFRCFSNFIPQYMRPDFVRTHIFYKQIQEKTTDCPPRSDDSDSTGSTGS